MKRLLCGIGANLYGQAVTVVLQIVSVPAFLHAWGEARFGVWLGIFAWTSVLSLADAGVIIAGGNAMVMALAAGEPARARRLFGDSMRFMMAVAIGLIAILVVLLPSLSGAIGGLHDPSVRATALVVAALTLAGLPLGLCEIGFRAGGGYAGGVARTSTIRLAETAAALAVAARGGSMLGAAEAMLAVRLVGTVLVGLDLRRRSSWLRAPRASNSRSGLLGLASSAFAAGLVPAALVLTIQGTTVAASMVEASSAVAVFVAARTLTRALVQVLGLVNHALMPEMTMAVGGGDGRRALALLRLNLLAGAGVLLPGWVTLVAFGPTLMRLWTDGRLQPDPFFFALMATAACLHGGWLSASNLLLAINRQGDYAVQLLAIAAVSGVLTLGLGRIWGLEGIAAASLIGEAAMVGIILPGQVRTALRPAALVPAGARR